MSNQTEYAMKIETYCDCKRQFFAQLDIGKLREAVRFQAGLCR